MEKTKLGANLPRQEWRNRIHQLHTNHGERGDKWLHLLYTSYLNRFLSDNNRIWTTGQWMITLSVAPFAAIPNLAKPSTLNFVFLAIPSITLIWVWLIIAENHRAFQEKSIDWMRAIESALDIERPGGDKVPRKSAHIGRNLVQKMRWVLAVGISLLWFTIILLTGFRTYV